MLIQNREGRVGRSHDCSLDSTIGWLEGKPIVSVDLKPVVLENLGSLDGCEEWPSVCQIVVERQILTVKLVVGTLDGCVQFYGTLTTSLNRRWLTSVRKYGGLTIIINPHAKDGQLLAGKAIVCSQIFWGGDRLPEEHLLLPCWSFAISFTTPVLPLVNPILQNPFWAKWRNLSGRC